MADDGDGDRGPLDNIFSSFFSAENHFMNMTRELDEMMQQMNDMFQEPGDVGSAAVGGYSQPPHTMSPRDAMLKEPDSNNKSSDCIACGPASRERTPMVPPFMSIMGGFGGQPPVIFPSVTEDSRTSRSEHSFHSGLSWSQSRYKQLPDGTAERVDKVMKNGRTCTTVTSYDPQGSIVSTNTTCDKPAIGAADKPNMAVELSADPQQPSQLNVYVAPQPGMTKKDTSFFNKLFGFNIFKPPKE